MQVPPAGLWTPGQFEIYVSKDGESCRTLYEKTCRTDDTVKYEIYQQGWQGEVQARYICLRAMRDLS